MSPELEFCRRLSALGHALFTAPTGGQEFAHPRGWQRTDPAGNLARLESFTGGAVCAVLGSPLAVVDVDTKNGADPAAVVDWLDALGVAILANIATPSGGRHFYVPGHPDLPTVHAKADRDGLEGLPGVEVLSHGTNTFLPGTRRPKYAGRGYQVLSDRLDEYAPALDAQGAILAGWVNTHRAARAQAGPVDVPAPVWDGRDPDAREAAYLAAVLAGQAREVAECPPGGRNLALFTAALKLGSFVAGAGLDEAQAWQVLSDAAGACGLTQDDGPAAVRASIRSGLANGKRNPRAVPAAQVIPEVSPAPGSGVTERYTTPEPVEPVATSNPLPEVETLEPASWAPVDLSRFLDSSYTAPTPELLPRGDGVCLLYPGLTHSFHGESESGKSLLALVEAVRILAAGGRVLFVDFESDPGAVTARLLEFGATPAQVEQQFVYVRPEVSHKANSREAAAFLAHLRERFDLAVIDGVTDALALWGAETKDNDGITRWARDLPKAIADNTGAAVVMVDHVTKDAESRGRFAIGGQAKLAALTGAAYTVEVSQPLGRGLRGVVVLRVAKDRPGHVRGHSGPMRPSDRTQEAARVIIDSTGPRPVVTIEAPRTTTGQDARPWRPTAIMEAVSRLLEDAPDPLSFNGVNGATKGREQHVRAALGCLVADGFVTTANGPRSSILHTSARPYRQADDPASDAYREPSDPAEHAGDSRPAPDRLTVSRPYTGERETDSHRLPETVGRQWETVAAGGLR